MSKQKNSVKFTFAVIDFLWTTIAYIYFISKPYIVITGIFYLVPVVIKSFKHWVLQDQKYLHYIYSVINTIISASLLLFEISVHFGVTTNPDWFPTLLIINVIYSFSGTMEQYEPYKSSCRGGRQR